MILLADLPTWIQAISAIASIIVSCAVGYIAWLTFESQKKINTLTDVVEQMKCQTDTLAKAYELQEQLSANLRMPYFVAHKLEIARYAIDGHATFLLTFKNSGLTAFNISFNRITSFEIYKSEIGNIEGGKTVEINVTPDLKIEGFKGLNIEFTMGFNDSSGRRYIQQVAVRDSTIIILPPRLINTNISAFDPKYHDAIVDFSNENASD